MNGTEQGVLTYWINSSPCPLLFALCKKMKKIIHIAAVVIILTLSGCRLFDSGKETVGNLELNAAQIAALYRQGDGIKRVALCVGIYRDSIYGYCTGLFPGHPATITGAHLSAPRSPKARSRS